MKMIKKTMYVVMLFAAVFISSCSSDDDNNDDGGGDGGNGGAEFLTAQIDGANYEAAQSPVAIIGATLSNNVLAVQGGTNDGETMRITIGDYNGVGSYSAGDSVTGVNSLMYVTVSPVASWLTFFGLAEGTIEITSDDGTTVEGTFSFAGYNAEDQTTKNITNGSFKANFD